MCQMCDEYEAELIRMGLIEEAKHVRSERHPEENRGKRDEPGHEPAAKTDADQRA